MNSRKIENAFRAAKEHYAALDVDVDSALETLSAISISVHCWQGDDVTGFEGHRGELGGGLAVTGQYPGKARTAGELRDDLDKALSLIPGSHRVNLHACYGEFGNQHADRDQVAPEHFRNWIAWAKAKKLGLDFNPTFFAHTKAAEGLTLTHPDKSIRRFWIEHGIRCREIGAAMGKALRTPCVTNVWIPDGSKDTPADRLSPRARLMESLDAVFETAISPKFNLDAVEPKLFGIGSESYVAGSHEFYLGYAIARRKMLCLDAGHYHPTEGIGDKISSVLLFLPEILLHVSRGVRWDSDHVVTLTDELQSIAREIVSNEFLERVHMGLDYFDASINRVAAWVIGARNLLRSLAVALLEPTARLRALEQQGDLTARLALQEEIKTFPIGAVWDFHCLTHDVPVGCKWIAEMKRYEKEVLLNR